MTLPGRQWRDKADESTWQHIYVARSVPVAQSVELAPHKRLVGGSSPSRNTKTLLTGGITSKNPLSLNRGFRV